MPISHHRLGDAERITNTRLKVLVVDDNADVAWSTGEPLATAGCDTRIALDGPSALEEARTFCPDVCVIDLSLTGMDGVELGERSRAQSGSHPPRLVALTGAWDVDSTHRTHNAGFAEHLVKPADPQRLVEAITGQPLAPA